MDNIYPVILQPTSKEVLVLPNDPKRWRKNKKRGPSELVVFCSISKLGLKEIRQDMVVRIDGHNYEPDFIYFDKEKNIAVDIELDEPYSASGRPVHFMNADGTNKDSERNKCFQDAGWYVFRFSEQQFFCHTASCMKEVYRLLVELGAVGEMPATLAEAPNLEEHNRWTYDDSRKLNREHFRKTYLGFDPSSSSLQDHLQCVKLLMPIIKESVSNKALRREMLSQLKGYFLR